MASKNNSVVKKSTVENKTFSYERGGVTLNFTLRVDIKEQMLAFMHILTDATSDLLIEVHKRFPKETKANEKKKDSRGA